MIPAEGFQTSYSVKARHAPSARFGLMSAYGHVSLAAGQYLGSLRGTTSLLAVSANLSLFDPRQGPSLS